MKRKVEQQKKLRTTFFMALLLLTAPYLSQPALSQVGIFSDWETGTYHAKESGTDRVLIFIAHGESTSSMNLSAVTYGGQSMTKVMDYNYNAASGYAYAAAFILKGSGVAAASSSTFNPTWSGTEPGSSGYASVFLSNVYQTTPTGATGTGGSTSNPVTTSSALATSDGDMVILAATCGNAGSYTLNNGFTKGAEQTMNATVTGTTGHKSATGANETPSATYSDWINRQMIIGFVVQTVIIDPNKASHPNPLNGAVDVSISANLLWDAPTGYTPSSYDVYLGTDPNAHNNPKYTVDTNSFDPPGNLAFGTTYYWAVDSNDAGTIYVGEDWTFTTHVLVLNASNPAPINGAGGVPLDVNLSWKKGEYAEKHDVYFGTGEAEVTDANRSNPLGVLVSQDHSTTTYDPPEILDLNTTYYWRIDEVNAAPYYTIFKGEVWSFMAYMPPPTWRVDERCFLDGPTGAFDDISVKDPSIVYSGGKWHLFYTGRDSSMWRMGYATAASIAGLKTATHTFMSSLNGGSYFCAPQVFWFEAKGKWYLIYQSGLGATFSTNTDINNPSGWTAGTSMGFSDGIDFWCISDDANMYCFYSAQDGSFTIKRRSTTVASFPYGWSSPSVAATNTFEAPCVYKNNADGRYYMLTEDINRYYELWTASSLGGIWTKAQEKWASKDTLIYNADHWTDQVSHGEIIRAGTNERMEIDYIDRCEILIQGVVDGDYGGYGNIPYDLGIIRHAGPGDLDLDCDVDFEDFAVLAGQWQQPPGVPSADIAPPGGDGIVNMNDLGLLVDSWLWGK